MKSRQLFWKARQVFRKTVGLRSKADSFLQKSVNFFKNLINFFENPSTFLKNWSTFPSASPHHFRLNPLAASRLSGRGANCGPSNNGKGAVSSPHQQPIRPRNRRATPPSPRQGHAPCCGNFRRDGPLQVRVFPISAPSLKVRQIMGRLALLDNRLNPLENQRGQTMWWWLRLP